MLKGFDKEFQYEMAGLAGAEFEVYAAEDIYTADHQVDADGQRTLYFAKDALVATVTTDADGYATVKNLPLGRYYVKEKNAPDTYVLNTVPENVEFAFAVYTLPNNSVFSRVAADNIAAAWMVVFELSSAYISL